MADATHEARYELVLNKLLYYAENAREDLFDQSARYEDAVKDLINAAKLPNGLVDLTEEWARRRHKLFFEIMMTETKIDWVDEKLLEVAELKKFTQANVALLDLLVQGTDFQEIL
jgi:uncharacterized protein Yka (UPF0111/DUF47 family)